ncbi:hypothetical protein NG794_27030, partial [Laspinema sp. D6]|nr:hypothetical protein [Laspinema sp. D3a]
PVVWARATLLGALNSQRFTFFQQALDIKGHGDNVRSGDFSEKGDYLLTASQDKTAKIWDKKGKLIYTLTGHREGVNSAYFFPDGQSVITASRDKTARVWPLLDQIYSGYKKWTSTV